MIGLLSIIRRPIAMKGFRCVSTAARFSLSLILATWLPGVRADADAAPWISSWSASPQAVWDPGFLFPSRVPPGLHGQTVRQALRLSAGGQRIRLLFSNVYGRQAITVGKASVGLSADGDAIAAASLRPVTFGGRASASILPGASLLSDALPLPVPNLASITVSVYLPQRTALTTFHWDSRQTTWIAAGDATHAPRLECASVQAETTARVLLAAVQVQGAKATQAVAVMGDSITDGAAASLDANHRWPDFLAERLAPRGVAVVNAGISGARLLSDGMGVNALARLERDVLAQPGVKCVIVMLGINDIAWPGTAFAPQASRPTLDALEAGYRQLVVQAHARGVRVIGATLTPFEGALQGTPLSNYYSVEKDALRQQLNQRIRQSAIFDGVIDFDAVLRDSSHPARLASRFDSGDHLHPGDAGNRAMAEAVDLQTLLPAGR